MLLAMFRVARSVNQIRAMMVVHQPIHSLSQWVTPQVRRVIAALAACEACGGIAFGRLCPECREHARPHVENDPYDVLGGEGGGLA
jgi:hypothetical protein